ncbi:ATP-binding protein [Microbacterium sp.]|uniref:sensor histidine kinase n=1 Tax=Microbacterium sp. TaxID=51671 RepID=UPI0025D85935|nr:ATP-binding protein [Microbacterium sp.]MBT9605388.1 hypothetical protein [Microbacterium sp.]
MTPARLIRRHVLAAIGVAVALLCALIVIEWRLATAEADRVTREAAGRVAERVSDALAATEVGGVPDAADLDARLEGFFAAGTVARVKVWRIDGETARVVYSDEPSLIGSERPYSPHLADRLRREGVVVHEVPDDVEHRFETTDSRELREAFLGFQDADGTPLRLEVYVPVFRDAWVTSTLTVYLPVLVAGMIALAAALAPLSIRLARGLAAAEADRREAVAFGLRAREGERLRLARRLHDDVLQDLTGSALALQAMASRPEADPARLTRVADTLADDARMLRTLLDDDLEVAPLSLRAALAEIASEDEAEPPVSVEVALDEDPDAETVRLLTEAARELVRNARRHAQAETIRVAVVAAGEETILTVADDGRGFAEDLGATARHGIRLLERAVSDAGGRLEIATGSRGTSVAVRLPRKWRAHASA